MKKLDIALTLALVLGTSTACATSRQTGEVNAGDRAEQPEETGDAFASAARDALDELNDDFEELTTNSARFDGDRAEAWAETREEILEVRQALATDVDRLQGASREDAQGIRSRVMENLETMTHHIELAKLLATDGGREFVSAAQQSLDGTERQIQEIESDARELPMEVREVASEALEGLRRERNDVEEAVTSLADAAPQEIEEQRVQLADDVAAVSASARRAEFELQAELDN
jgi:hypothetical protein